MQATDHHHHQQQRRKVSGSGSRFAFPSVGVGVVGAPAGRREVARVVGVWRSVGLPGWTSAGLAGRPYLLLLEKKEPSFPENFGFQEPHGNRKDPLVPLFLLRDLFPRLSRAGSRTAVTGFELWSRHSPGSCVRRRELLFRLCCFFLDRKFSGSAEGSLLDLQVGAFSIISELFRCWGGVPFPALERKWHPLQLFQLWRIQIAP